MANAKLPIDFTDKAKEPPSADGTGYPHRISANDLMRNFHYAALVAEEGWIESDSGSLYDGRKLKLPAIPSGDGVYLLSVNGGTIGWSQYEEKEVSICEDNYPVDGIVLFRPSE
jgi:hypothetical protein